jgi:hypothetical protein
MGRFVDAIRCHILEKYMSSYMRERNMDALLVLRNENKWAMTGKYFNMFVSQFYFLIFSFLIFILLSVIFVVFPVLVADVDVKEDGIFIRLRKEEVVREDKDSSTEVSVDVLEPVVEKVPEIGSEVTVPLETIPEDLIFESGEAFSFEGVDNIPMEELFCGSHGDGSLAGSSDITSISLDTVLDLELAS